MLKSPLRYASAALGIFGLVSLALFTSGEYLGIGFGGIERMIVYPAMIWALLIAGHLLSWSGEIKERPASGSGEAGIAP